MTTEDIQQAGLNAESIKVVEKTMADFLEAMQLRDEFSIRIGRRTSQIIRVGAFTVTLLSIAIVYLTATLGADMQVMRTKMEAISQTMSHMDQRFGEVAQHTDAMQDAVQRMSANLQYMPQMTQSVADMRDASSVLPQMTDHVGSMKRDISSMRQDLTAMHQDMMVMNQSVGAMNASMNHMGYDVNRM